MGSFFPSLQHIPGGDPKQADYWPAEDSDYFKKTTMWLEAAFEEAKFELGQHDEMSQIQKYISYLVGRQWPRGRPSYRAAPVNNRIWRLVWELIALLTDIRPMFEIKSLQKEYNDHATMLNKVTKSWWFESDADMSLALIIIYAILTTGYAKLTWNGELRNGEGDFELLPLGPNDVLTLKARNTLDSSQAVIYQSVMPLGWFKQRFPVRGHLVQPNPDFSRFASMPERPGHVPAMLYDQLSPAMKRVVGNPSRMQQSTYPEALYREFWVKDFSANESNVSVKMGDPKTNWCYEVKSGERLYPRGRLISMGGRAILYDGPNPYWHGRYPFACLRMNVVPWQFLGLSELAPLLPLQDIVNNILAGILDMVKKAVNPGFFAPKNAFSEAQWDSLDWGMPGIKAAFSQNVAHKPEFAPTPQLQGFVLQTMMLAAREMDQSSGIAAVSQAMQKKQIPSGETLDKIKEAQQTPLRLKGRNIEVFLRDLGSQNIWNVFQFYSARRRMYMLGKAGLTFEDFDWDPGTCVPAGTRPEDHARRFVFLIQPGSLLNFDRMLRAQTALMLRRTHDISRKTLYAELDMNLDVTTEERELKREEMEGVPAIVAKQRGMAGPGAGPKK